MRWCSESVFLRLSDADRHFFVSAYGIAEPRRDVFARGFPLLFDEGCECVCVDRLHDQAAVSVILQSLHHLVLAVGCRRRKQSALQVERAAVTGEAVKFGFCHGVGKLLVQFGDLRAQSLGLRFEVFRRLQSFPDYQ